MSRMVRDELVGILPVVLIFDVLAYIASLFFLGLNIEMALGLLLGTVLLFLNLSILGSDSERATFLFRISGDVKRAKRRMALGYTARALIVAAALYCSFKADFLNTLGVMIPFLYPKPVYMIKAFISGKKEGK